MFFPLSCTSGQVSRGQVVRSIFTMSMVRRKLSVRIMDTHTRSVKVTSMNYGRICVCQSFRSHTARTAHNYQCIRIHVHSLAAMINKKKSIYITICCSVVRRDIFSYLCIRMWHQCHINVKLIKVFEGFISYKN